MCRIEPAIALLNTDERRGSADLSRHFHGFASGVVFVP
jgi:hypothetical protein